MQLIFRPIFIIFFVFLTLSVSLSMQRTQLRRAQSQDVLAQVKRRHQQLLLQEQELAYQEELMAYPSVRDKLIRDQKWLKKIGEQNLKLKEYQYQPRPVILPQTESPSPWAQWQKILF